MTSSQGSYCYRHKKRMGKQHNKDQEEILAKNLRRNGGENRPDINRGSFKGMTGFTGHQNRIQMPRDHKRNINGK